MRQSAEFFDLRKLSGFSTFGFSLSQVAGEAIYESASTLDACSRMNSSCFCINYRAGEEHYKREHSFQKQGNQLQVRCMLGHCRNAHKIHSGLMHSAAFFLLHD